MPLTFAKPRRRRFFRWRTLVILLVVAAVIGGVLFFTRKDDSPPALPVAETDAFLSAWTATDAPGMAAVVDAPPTNLGDVANSLVKAEPGSSAKYTRTSLVRTKTGDAVATYHARVNVGGFGPVEWNGTLNLTRVKVNKKMVWRIKWQPTTLHPGFEADDHLTVRETWPARASISAADGSALTGNQQVVVIGLEPGRLDKLPEIKQKLQELLGVEPASVDAALNAPGVQPNYFVPVAETPKDQRYQLLIRPSLVDFNGLSFRLKAGVQSASSVLGPQIIGTVGEITGDRLKELGPPYHAGLQVGLTGLQASYEKRLAGTPSADVLVVNGTEKIRTVKHFAGKPAQPVQLTIDPHVQQAAENALAGVAHPAALVAIDAPTGEVRAVVSKPDNGFDRALEGKYPPGSTFKVVTTTGLLQTGSTGATPAPCPPTITVNGRTFHNFEGESGGALDLAHAFAISCNNAFIGLNEKAPNGTLEQAATAYGFGLKYDWPLNVAGGSFPTPTDSTELAAASIGQGRVTASPLQMAAVAAAVDGGRFREPVLTSKPKVRTVERAPFAANVLAELRSFMASVVQSGTAAGAGLPPGTFGKTGTAEFGNDNPPHTHAWFIGYRGDLAFAVIVEDGGVGGQVAAPLAANFLNGLG